MKLLPTLRNSKRKLLHKKANIESQNTTEETEKSLIINLMMIEASTQKLQRFRNSKENFT